MTDFDEGTIESIIEGIFEIGKVIVQLPTDLKNCTAMGDDLEKLEDWAEIFIHPKELIAAL